MFSGNLCRGFVSTAEAARFYQLQMVTKSFCHIFFEECNNNRVQDRVVISGVEFFSLKYSNSDVKLTKHQRRPSSGGNLISAHELCMRRLCPRQLVSNIFTESHFCHDNEL